jgi:hypothetical protein
MRSPPHRIGSTPCRARRRSERRNRTHGRAAPGALVLADLSDDPDLDPYLAYVRAAFTSLTLLGLEISLL